MAVFIDAKNDRVARWYASYGAVRLLDAPLTLLLPLATLDRALKNAGRLNRSPAQARQRAPPQGRCSGRRIATSGNNASREVTESVLRPNGRTAPLGPHTIEASKPFTEPKPPVSRGAGSIRIKSSALTGWYAALVMWNMLVILAALGRVHGWYSREKPPLMLWPKPASLARRQLQSYLLNRESERRPCGIRRRPYLQLPAATRAACVSAGQETKAAARQ
jgi:hypothetical protein